MISRHAPPSCQDFRTQLQAKLIKEHLNNGIMIGWVPSQAQLADGWMPVSCENVRLLGGIASMANPKSSEIAVAATYVHRSHGWKVILET